MTYERRDVPITESNAVAKNILAGVCDKCHEVLVVPPQSIPAIQEARDTATVPVEAVLPSIQGCSLLVMRGQAIPCCLGIPAECLSRGVYMLSAAEANQVQGPTA